MSTFYTGNTGGSTGAHLDFRVWDVEKGGYTDPRPHTGILRTGDTSVTDAYEVTSPYGMRTHPIHGDQRMHHGIDYATPSGTPISIAGGTFLTTFDDSAGGGITSQYSFTGEDGRQYEALLMHGNKDNQIFSSSAITDGSPSVLPDTQSVGVPDTSPPTTTPQQEAVERVQNYSDMSKSEMNAAYDKMRSEDPNKASVEGLKMHKAFFNK